MTLYPVMAAAFLIFSLVFAGHRNQITRFRIILLIIVPVAIAILYPFNDSHGLIGYWENYNEKGPFLIPQFEAEHILTYIHEVYVLLLMLPTAGLIAISGMRVFRIHRIQAILCLSIVVVFFMAAITSILPPKELDLTPIAFITCPLLAGLAIFRYGLLDLKPIANNTLVDNISDGIMVLDSNGRIVDLNSIMLNIISIPADEIIGKSAISFLISASDIEYSFRGELQTEADISFIRDSRRYYYNARISPLSDGRGVLTGRLIVMRDITRLRQAEAELLQSRNDLQQRNKELDSFAHTVAHDIQGPLASLVAYAEILLNAHENTSDEQKMECLRQIVDGGHKTSDIVEELLLFSTVRKANSIELQQLDMAAIVDQVLMRITGLIARYDVKVKMPQSWPVCIGYAPWIEEVWFNYISNGIKYGGNPPEVELGAQSEPDGLVKFWIRDNGAGIAPENLPKLFLPFEQLNSISADYGHGLGLSIVARIIEKLGGRVGVENEGISGRGSLFYFMLPDHQDSPKS